MEYTVQKLGCMAGISTRTLSFDGKAALSEHRERLMEKRQQLDLLIANVDKTIALTEGRIRMKDKEKFAGFKQKMIEENEKKYGQEIREKYGVDTVKKSYQKVKNMTPEEYDAITNTNRYFPLHVQLDERTVTTGVIMCEQAKSLDLFVRNASFKEKAPIEILEEVVDVLIGIVEVPS